MFVGCASTRTDLHSTGPKPYFFPAEQYATAFDAAKVVLRQEKFDLDRQDYRFGVVACKPQLMPSIVEPWHQRVDSISLQWESTINSQRRVVNVYLKPGMPLNNGKASSGGENQPPKFDRADSPANLSAESQSRGRARSKNYYLEVQVLIERQQIPVRHLTGSTRGGAVFASLKAVPTEWEERGILTTYWSPVDRDYQLEYRLQDAIVQLIKESAEAPSSPER